MVDSSAIAKCKEASRKRTQRGARETGKETKSPTEAKKKKRKLAEGEDPSSESWLRRCAVLREECSMRASMTRQAAVRLLAARLLSRETDDSSARRTNEGFVEE